LLVEANRMVAWESSTWGTKTLLSYWSFINFITKQSYLG
jgi:hypothetical protein